MPSPTPTDPGPGSLPTARRHEGRPRREPGGGTRGQKSMRVASGVVLAMVLGLTACAGGEAGAPVGTGAAPASATTTAPPVVEPPAPVTDPTCSDVEAFADGLRRTGIAIDHQPTWTVAMVVEASEVVAAGRLTGEATVVEHETLDAIGFEVRIDDPLRGPNAPGDTVMVFTSFGSMGTPDRPGPDIVTTPVPVGAPVVVFASPHGEAQRLFAHVEGFAVACPEGAPIGQVGHLGEWNEIASLPALLDAARAATT